MIRIAANGKFGRGFESGLVRTSFLDNGEQRCFVTIRIKSNPLTFVRTDVHVNHLISREQVDIRGSQFSHFGPLLVSMH